MNKKKNNFTVAIILASGTSKRFGGSTPKQYKKIKIKTILEYSLSSFIKCRKINFVVVVYNKKHYKFIAPLVNKYKKIKFILGANNRQQSCLNALNAIAKEEKYSTVIIHDAARPLVSLKLINKLIKSKSNNHAVIPALKVTNSLKLVKKNFVVKSIERKDLSYSQTPQLFPLKKLNNAYDKINKKNLLNYTDDAQIFSEAGNKVLVVPGDEDNFKITNLNDFKKARKLLLSESIMTKTGQGIDFHRFTKGKDFTLFGVKIHFNKTIEAHSDGDTGVHALIDAILGTLSLGDIGSHFPDTDAKFKNIDSLILLKKTLEILKKYKGKILHVDNTIICERPKINPYIAEMKKKISSILQLNINSISIKATTTEKMGFIGRKEGIAAFSIATIRFINDR